MRNPALFAALPFSFGLLFTACQSGVGASSTASSATSATAATSAPAALRGTRWVLHQLNGQAPVTSGQEVYLQLSSFELQAEGQAGCNRFRGSFTLPATGRLQFGSLLSTRMACPAMGTESAFLQALTTTRSYHISADTLYLHAEPASTVLATFRARKAQGQ